MGKFFKKNWGWIVLALLTFGVFLLYKLLKK